MVDSKKGYIRAMASSQAFSADNQFNLATQALRQPGSTFKTFVLTEAIRQGINPYTTLYGSKKLDFVDAQYGPIDVSTYSNTYRGRDPDGLRAAQLRQLGLPAADAGRRARQGHRDRVRHGHPARRASCPTSPRSASARAR